MRIVFVDTLTLRSALRILIRAARSEVIYSFAPLPSSGPASWLLTVLRGLRLFPADIRQVEHNVGHIRNEQGESDWMALRREYFALAVRIRNEDFPRNPVIRALADAWDSCRIEQHFHGMIERDLFLEFSRMELVRWMARAVLDVPIDECLLCVGGRPWMGHVKRRAAEVGLPLASYPQFWSHDRSPTLIGAVRQKLRVVWRSLTGRRAAPPKTETSAKEQPQEQPGGIAAEAPPQADGPRSNILVQYEHGSLDFAEDSRSQWFYFHGTELPYSQVILHGLDPARPPDAETMAEIRRRGIRLEYAAPGGPAWRPSLRVYRRLLAAWGRLAWRLPGKILRHGLPSPTYVREAAGLLVQYAAWGDYYASHNVGINIDSMHTHTGQTLALDELGGVTCGYQYSSAVLGAIDAHCSGEDVFFVFSPLYEQVFRDVQAPYGLYVHSGYLYDRAIRAARQAERFGSMADQLRRHGARFILCFFDENSADRWYIWESSRHAAVDYEFLLNWLHDDPTLGLIFKPKRPLTLLKRLHHISDLFEQAEQTGRCAVVGTDATHIVGTTFPAELAMVADVSVGKIRGSTAALEAALAGRRSVLLRMGISDHPFLEMGRDRVVFDSWDAIRAAVERFRGAAETCGDMGDWSAAIAQADPFRDGQAAERIGSFIASVHKRLVAGDSKTDALRHAAHAYAERWGDGHVSPGTIAL